MLTVQLELEDNVAKPLQAALDEVERELSVRERCYDRWVQERKLSKTDADDRGTRMTWAAGFLGMLLVAVQGVTGEAEK